MSSAAATERITRNAEVLCGKPTVRGLRISVEQVLRALAGGISVAGLLEDFPELEKADISACLQFAADQAARPI